MNIPFNYQSYTAPFEKVRADLNHEPIHNTKLNMWRRILLIIQNIRAFIARTIEHNNANFSNADSALKTTLNFIGDEFDKTNNNVEELFGDVHSLETRMTTAENEIEDLKTNQTTVSNKVDSFANLVQENANNLAILNTRVQSNIDAITEYNEKIAINTAARESHAGDYDALLIEIHSLDDRLESTEDYISAILDSDLSSFNTQIANINKALETLSNNVSENNTNIETLTQDVTLAGNQTEYNKQDIEALQERVTALEQNTGGGGGDSDLDDLKATVATLESEYQKLSSQVTTNQKAFTALRNDMSMQPANISNIVHPIDGVIGGVTGFIQGGYLWLRITALSTVQDFKANDRYEIMQFTVDEYPALNIETTIEWISPIREIISDYGLPGLMHVVYDPMIATFSVYVEPTGSLVTFEVGYTFAGTFIIPAKIYNA